MAIQEDIKMPICQISCLLLMLISVVPKAESLRISSIEVPPAVMNSSQVTLICNYDLQGDQLYSVTWYKNYVEFYKFQPSEQAQTTTPTAMGSSGVLQSADSQQAQHSKREFELEGINLNLASSNSTHVYLQQTSLASEGTYKCEVSADSPSFVTISSERQMKVYVLPKQKLSIVDNSISSTMANGAINQLILSAGQQQQQLSQVTLKQAAPLTYNLNDLVNMTCISGPSKPPAKLSWYLNDSPIPSSSKWLSQQTTVQQHSSKLLKQHSEQQLTESRLTVAFRVQSSHLARQQQQQHSSSLLSGSNERQPFQLMRLRCVAKLSIEFASETSIVVSGGKTTLKKRQQQQLLSQMSAATSSLPTPSSLQLNGSNHQRDASSASSSSSSLLRGHQPVGAAVTSESSVSVYRWPRTQSGSNRASGFGFRRNNNNFPDSFVDAWVISPVTFSTLTTAGSDQEPPPAGMIESTSNGNEISGVPGRSIRPVRQHSVVVWTSRQLRDQAEHIDQLLRLAHPNELDTPLIEAKTQLEPDDQAAESSLSTNGGNGNAGEDLNNPALSAATTPSYFEQPDSTEADGSPVESWDESDSGDQTSGSTYPSSSVPIDADTSRQSGSTAGTDQDYELNDLVQFTCSPRITPAERDATKGVHLKWFINNQEIFSPKVNAFDGSKFYYSRESLQTNPTNNLQDNNTTTITTTTRQQSHIIHPSLSQHTYSSSSRQRQSFRMQDYNAQPSEQNPLEAMISDASNSDNSMLNNNSSGERLSSNQQKQSSSNSRSLFVEFTPSLFQSKELNLKCRILIEQPLIEYDSQLVASVSLSQFIQVDQTNQRHNRPQSPMTTLRGNQQQQQSRQHGRFYSNSHRYRNGFARPTQQQSSSAVPVPYSYNYCLICNRSNITTVLLGLLPSLMTMFLLISNHHQMLVFS